MKLHVKKFVILLINTLNMLGMISLCYASTTYKSLNSQLLIITPIHPSPFGLVTRDTTTAKRWLVNTVCN